MKYIFCYAFLSCLITYMSSAQDKMNPYFLKMTQIDSIVNRIDESEIFINRSLTGVTEFGTFKGTYSITDEKEICKIEYHFDSDSSGIKIFYYDKKKLIKIRDKELNFYNYSGILIDDQGKEVDPFISKKLLAFEKEYTSLVYNISEGP